MFERRRNSLRFFCDNFFCDFLWGSFCVFLKAFLGKFNEKKLKITFGDIFDEGHNEGQFEKPSEGNLWKKEGRKS